ncbi:MAG: hypothetical protein Q8S84_09130 [bacterium]|nr:hypothetical protein [bacterium]
MYHHTGHIIVSPNFCFISSNFLKKSGIAISLKLVLSSTLNQGILLVSTLLIHILYLNIYNNTSETNCHAKLSE